MTEDSPAARAGLKAGDVITKVNTTEIRDARHLLLTVSQIAPNTEVALEYLRDGKKSGSELANATRSKVLFEELRLKLLKPAYAAVSLF